MANYFKLKVTGFNDSKRIIDKDFCSIESGKTYVDGWNLSELQIQSTMFDQQDVEDLIKVLQIAKHTLPKTENQKEKEIKIANIKVGTIIRFATNKNWDNIEEVAMVTAYSITEDKIWVGQQVISIRTFLENIESGRYKVVLQYPK